MKTPTAAASRVSAPLNFKVIALALLAPTVPQAVNGRITAPANGATIVVPAQANLRVGDRVVGVIGNYRTDPVVVVTPGAAVNIPIPALQLWFLNLEGPREWRYEVQIGDSWLPSASITIDVALNVTNGPEDFSSYPIRSYFPGMLMECQPFLLRSETVSFTINTGAEFGYEQVTGKSLWPTFNGTTSFLLKQSCRRIQFYFVQQHSIARKINIYREYDGSDRPVEVLAPITEGTGQGVFTYQSTVPFRRVSVENINGNLRIDYVTATP